MADDTLVLTGPVLQQIKADDLLVTPTGGSQGTLAALLAAGGGSSGPIAATTLSASSTVTLSPANANVIIAPTGTGTHAIDNMTVGVTTPLAGKFTTLAASGAVSGAGITALFASPPAIGGTLAAAGTFAAATATSLTVTGNTSITATKIGFYNASAVAQQTGVAVSAAAIHAALVNLGLITA